MVDMRKVLPVLYALAGAVLLLIPVAAYAQGLVPCDGIACNLCDVGELMQKVIDFMIVGLAIPLAALMFAYAGVLYVTAGANPTRVGKAHKIFKNVLIGFLIAISGWLIINTIMTVMFSKSFFNGGEWFQIQCIENITNDPEGGGRLIGTNFADLLNIIIPNAKAPPPPVSGSIVPIGTDSTGSPVGCPTGSTYDQRQQICIKQDGTGIEPVAAGDLCPTNNTACNTSFLQSVGYSARQAAAMSCIAMTESSGDSGQVNPDGGACGTFQILPSNWRNPNLHRSPCSTSTSCRNEYCNAQTAYLLSQSRLVQGQTAYGDWTCPGCNAKAAGCVQKYDPGH